MISYDPSIVQDKLVVPPTIYISGPMSGIEDFNHAAFNNAAQHLRDLGWNVKNPAENFGGVTTHSREKYMKLDIKNILESSFIWALPNWQDSKGARLEILVGMEIGCTVLTCEDGKEVLQIEQRDIYELMYEEEVTRYSLASEPSNSDGSETVLTEASRLIHGARQGDYGHPYHDFSRTAAMWTSLFQGHEFTPSDVALGMICVKLSRLANNPNKRDSIVDVAGYAGTLEMVLDYEGHQ